MHLRRSRNNTIVFMLLFSLLILAFTTRFGTAQSDLEITAKCYRTLADIYPCIPNWPTFTYREIVTVCGNLSLNQSPVEDGLVAVQVENPSYETVVVRTVPAETVPSKNWDIKIVSFYSSDQLGRPKTDFRRNTFAYFTLTAKNNYPFSKTVLLTISVHDIDETYLGPLWFGPTEIAAGGNMNFTAGLLIPEWASGGTAKAYANVYTDWPKNHGYPCCPEKATSFNIEYSTDTAYELPKVDNANYNASFRLPPDAPLGIYHVSISGIHGGQKAFRTSTFTAQDCTLGDTNLDNKIDLYDVAPALSTYASKSGDPRWLPRFDLDPSGNIDIYDIVIILTRYGQTY